MKFVLDFMWKINKDLPVSECSVKQIIWYVWRTVSNLTTSDHFGYEEKRLEYLGLNVWTSIM